MGPTVVGRSTWRLASLKVIYEQVVYFGDDLPKEWKEERDFEGPLVPGGRDQEGLKPVK